MNARTTHASEIYPGTHTSKVAERFRNHVLPFFGRTLSATASPRHARATISR